MRLTNLNTFYAKVFVFVCTINELQKMGYVEDYVSSFEGASVIFHKYLDQHKENLTEADLDLIIDFGGWEDQDVRQKLKDLYRSYHSLKWVDVDQPILKRYIEKHKING